MLNFNTFYKLLLALSIAYIDLLIEIFGANILAVAVFYVSRFECD